MGRSEPRTRIQHTWDGDAMNPSERAIRERALDFAIRAGCLPEQLIERAREIRDWLAGESESKPAGADQEAKIWGASLNLWVSVLDDPELLAALHRAVERARALQRGPQRPGAPDEGRCRE